MFKGPLAAALLFQAGLLILGLALAWLIGMQPWPGPAELGPALLPALLLTAPLVALLFLLARSSWTWVHDLTGRVERLLRLIFRHSPPGAVLAVSVLAGLGEELLFRGVIQGGLSSVTGALPALALASVLFGLAHAITPAYFIIATMVGIYLGTIYQATGNLWIVVIIHALYDWIAIRYYLRRR